jgi:hypothetical protein
MERAAHLATVVGALVAAVALLVGVYEFTKTQHMARKNLELQIAMLQKDREIKATELFLKFNEQKEEFAGKPAPRKGEAAYWRANALLAATEAVFKLTRGDKGWEETVSWMLEEQRPFLLQSEFSCKTFAGDFLLRMKKAAPDLKCK